MATTADSVSISNKVATLQTGLRTPTNDAKFTNYAYWISGANSKNSALQQYDLLRTGYVRLFVLQLPKFVEALLGEESKKFKHMLEFGNVGIDGIQGFSVETTQATGGYAGTSVELPTSSKDDTSSVTIKVYETQGSLIRTYIDFWITGTFDPYTGLSHYHGARDLDPTFEMSQANHTMEVLVVAMDPTGDKAEYSCLLTNLFPKSSNHDHFNFDPGQHELVQLSLEFTCNKYMSSQINYIGQEALNQFKILRNFLNTYSGYGIANFQAGGTAQTYFNNASKIEEWQTQKASDWFGSGATGEINPLSSYMDKSVLPASN